MAIVCKSPGEIEKMRRSGHIVRQVLESVEALVSPGVSTMELEKTAEKWIREAGAKPAFKGYYDYPCVLCTSINQEVVHGIPSSERVLKAGDIVSIDCGVVLDGYYGDAAITVPVGDGILPELAKLVKVTEQSLYKGIEAARVGNTIGDVGSAVQQLVESTDSASSGNLWDTESARGCTRTRKSRIMVCPVTDRSCAKAWCWQSNRWSTPVVRGCGCWTISGRQLPKMDARARISNIAWRSPGTGR